MELRLTETTHISTTDALRFETRSNKTLVVSPQTGGYIVLEDTRILEALQRLESGLTLSELSQQWTGERDELRKNVLKLFERGILSLDLHAYGTSSSRPGSKELKVLSPKSAANNYPVLGIFHVHNYCNLACTYCYTIEEGISRAKLSLELMKRFIDQHAALPTRFSALEFHGGEPTMAFKEIEAATDYAVEVHRQLGKPLSFSIQTNAYSLTPAIIEFLKKHAFKVRVSVDGSKETHDRFRVNRGGKGSYDKVVAGIRQLQAAGINPFAVCVVHRSNVDQIIEMYEAMAALEVASIRFLPVFKTLNAKESDWLDGDTYFNAYFGLIKHLAQQGRAGRKLIPLSNLIAGELGSLRSFKREYMCMRGPCGAGTNMIAIDVNGDLYPCEEMIGKPEFVIGNLTKDSLKESLDTHPLMHTLKTRHVEEIPECNTCTWKQMCHGGCVHKSYTHFKRLDRKSEHCSYYKKIYQELIWLEAEQPGSWEALRGA